jgi:hypothetical protein
MVVNAGNKFIDLEHFDNVISDRFKNADLKINHIEVILLYHIRKITSLIY